jgi:hypothetical protein
MSKETALLVIHARMLNCSWRKIAELFTDDTRQDAGRRLVYEAEITLGLNQGAIDSESLYERTSKIHSSLSLVG